VLGALAALCVAVVGWRFVESKYLGSTPVAGGPAPPSVAASSTTHPPEAIYAVPQIGRASDDPWAPAPTGVSTDASSVASTHGLPRSLDGSHSAPPLADAGPAGVGTTGRLPLPPQVSASAGSYEENGPAGDYGASFATAAYAEKDGPTAIEIRPGDSFWLISERAYGTGAYFKALYRFHESSIAEPDRLPVGRSLEIPPVATLRELFPEDVPTDASSTDVARLRSYRTKRGDTALSVAQSQLGDASRWTDVFRLNQRAVSAPDAPLPEHYELKLPPAPMMAAAPAERPRSIPPVGAPSVR
jgi:nucleoid-associated protein YgaU